MDYIPGAIGVPRELMPYDADPLPWLVLTCDSPFRFGLAGSDLPGFHSLPASAVKTVVGRHLSATLRVIRPGLGEIHGHRLAKADDDATQFEGATEWKGLSVRFRPEPDTQIHMPIEAVGPMSWAL